MEEDSEKLSSLSAIFIAASSSISHFLHLYIDEEKLDICEIDEFMTANPYSSEYKITLDTKALVQALYSGNGDIDEYLFTSVESFRDNFDELGLNTPLFVSKLNTSSPSRIHVFGLGNAFGGPQLAIVPTHPNEEGDEWLKGSTLPSSEDLLKQVHLVTNDTLNLEPRSFELTWGDLDSELARPFAYAYGLQLLVSLCSNFYSLQKVHYKGVKHVEASVERVDTPITNDWLKTISDSLKWCYSVEDPSVPLQLFIDRLSLEYNTGSLFLVGSSTFQRCLEQAKNNYKFVIAKRSDDYRKELKEVYADIRTVTDKYMAKSASLSAELLKSLMAIGFVFTVGTVSKAIVNAELFHSKEGILLFKVIAIYLVVSFYINWLHSSAELKISFKSLQSWSKKLHNHIPTKEVDNLIKKQIIWSRLFYLTSLALVTAIQHTLALAAYNAEGVLFTLGLR
ncbi:hypothetical protein [Enterovibrio norvegicus]|uniref:hypothetical protein n=1 Tax=Enterovibrio norvegicus TaxID=188144 RepID=UPI00352E1A04